MNCTTDPAALTKVEIDGFWNTYKNSRDGAVYFLEEIFKCDRLTAQAVAECIAGAHLTDRIISKLDDLRYDTGKTIDEIAEQLREMA